MSEIQLRRMTEKGNRSFLLHLRSLRLNSSSLMPEYLTRGDEFSEPCGGDISLKIPVFANRYEMGIWLVDSLSPLDRRKITFDHCLWNWLACVLFNYICPPGEAGKRAVLRDELYVLESQYDYLRYYKHLVRTPWLAVLEHGRNAQVLFKNTRGVRSDIEETLAASQQIFGDKTVMAGAHALYFDESKDRPKTGAGGKGGGSPRRLTAFVQQISRTYDIPSCTVDQFLELLPSEFDKFRQPPIPE